MKKTFEKHFKIQAADFSQSKNFMVLVQSGS